MDGSCRIKFEESRTVFTFRCPAEPLTVVEWPETKDFEVPEDTWGIAIDDSKIQRKLMGRILAHAGVQENRRIVIGQSPTEVSSVEPTIVDLLKNHRKAKILVLIDENLDFGVNESEHVIISGSLVMKSILERLTPNQERRVFALVRSANDSAEDVALYLSRTHGFFPKVSSFGATAFTALGFLLTHTRTIQQAPMQRERVREILAPLWAERFLANLSSASTKSVRSLDDIGLEDAVSREDLLFSLGAVDRLVHENEMDEKEWSHIWGSLHALKGDLMVIEESPLVDEALALIGTMKGDSMPEDFASQWTKVREVVLKAVSRSSTSSIDS